MEYTAEQPAMRGCSCGNGGLASRLMDALPAIYVWVEIGLDGREGVIAAGNPVMPSSLMTLQHRDYQIAQKLRPIALAHARASGRVVRLVKFDRAQTLEEIAP